MRLDKFLAEKYRVSRQQIQKLIDEGCVTVNGNPVRKNQPALENSRIEVSWPPVETLSLVPENIPLEIIYQDRDIAVINKPAGLAVHPYGRVVSGTLVNALLYHLQDLSGIGGVFRPGIVHRLDKDTSGLMVTAKNDFSHQFLSGEFHDRRVQKTYLAFIKGVPAWSEQEVVVPIAHKRGDWSKMTVGFRKGRESCTRVKVVRKFPGAALVEVRPRTGRTHQIRVVMDFLGFPIIGDRNYGKPDALDKLAVRQALHAAGLSFRHPRSKVVLSFGVPLPDDLRKLAGNLTKVQ